MAYYSSGFLMRRWGQLCALCEYCGGRIRKGEEFHTTHDGVYRHAGPCPPKGGNMSNKALCQMTLLELIETEVGLRALHQKLKAHQEPAHCEKNPDEYTSAMLSMGHVLTYLKHVSRHIDARLGHVGSQET